MSGVDTIQLILDDLFARDEVLGAVAASRDGLALAASGMPSEQASLVAALGAPLAIVSEQAMARLGGGAELLTIDSADGMLHVRGHGDLALIVLTERCASMPLAAAMQSSLADLTAVLPPVAV